MQVLFSTRTKTPIHIINFMRGKWAYDSISFLDARPERIEELLLCVIHIKIQNKLFLFVCYLSQLIYDSKNYTTDEVKQLIKHFVKTADFIDFNREYGITGWKELDKWLEQNVK